VGEKVSDTDAHAEIFYAYNPTVGSGHTFSQTSSTETVFVSAYSGTNTTGGVLVNSAAWTSGSKTTGFTMPLAPCACGGLIVTGWAGDTNSTGIGNHNATTLDVQSSQAEYGAHAYTIPNASTPAYQLYWTWTTSQYAVGVAASFAPAQQNCTASPQEAVGALPTEARLQGWWTLDEGSGSTAYDSSGNNATGTWYGNQVGTSGYYSVGIVGPYCGTFDGSTDYISVPNSSFSMSSYTASGFTVSVWANITNTSTYRSLLSKTSGAQPGPFDTYSSGTQMVLYLGNGAQGNTQSVITSSSVVSTGVWQHWAFVFDGRMASIYCNGVLKAGPTAISVAVADAGNALRIGMRSDSGTVMYGLIDDPRIYSRALSGAEISLLYSQASESFGAMDSAARQAGFSRGPTETLSPSQSVAGLGAHFALPTETHAASDAVTGGAGRFASPAEAHTASDAIAGLGAHFARPAETHTASDLIAELGAHFATPAETHTPSDAVAGSAAHFAAPSETHTASSATTGLGAHFAAPAETHTASDLIAELGAHFATPAETHTPSDAVAGSAAHFAAPSETHTASDATAGLGAHFAAPAETHTASDAIAGLGAHFASPSEMHMVSDTLAKSAGRFASPSETYAVSDGIAGLGAHFAAPAETHTASDAIAGLGAHFASPTEEHAVSDAIAGFGAHFASPGELHTASDTLASLGAHFAAALELLAPQDGVARSAAYARGIRELLLTSDLAAERVGPQARHRFSVPGQAKSGVEPARVKSGVEAGRAKSGAAPPH
jgi:hypothetical protein